MRRNVRLEHFLVRAGSLVRAKAPTTASAGVDQNELRSLTKAHYEQFPFIAGGDERVALWHRRLGTVLPNSAIRYSKVLDVGCGSGDVARSLAERGASVVAVDLTRLAVQRAQASGDVRSVQCDALALPFRDDAFDHSLALGVLHHTPDCRAGLAEMVRVTRDTGTIIIGLYSKWTPYHFVYLATGRLRARVPGERLHNAPRWVMALTRAFVTFQIRQRLDDRQLVNVLADQFWTPRASFHTPREIRRWSGQLGLVQVGRRWDPFYMNDFVFRVDKSRVQ
ncbi:class I SAM-dependent methyltransferase [Nocardia sp. NPDC127606]|uniref:class I SAM-dependent methyltransferase n=1 Tax=Nocardia sp. NPDC127606 TaxID=3345406 RepID=UPI00362DACB1